MATDPRQLPDRERGLQIIQNFERRIGEGGTTLEAPGCERGCDPCARECALRKIKADWWRSYLRETGAGLDDVVIYAAHRFQGRG